MRLCCEDRADEKGNVSGDVSFCLSVGIVTVSALFFRRYYLKEVQALATQTENPFMVRYFDCWVEDDKLYILFELCDGTLADRTQSGPQMSEPELCRIACNALMVVHRIYFVEIF